MIINLKEELESKVTASMFTEEYLSGEIFIGSSIANREKRDEQINNLLEGLDFFRIDGEAPVFAEMTSEFISKMKDEKRTPKDLEKLGVFVTRNHRIRGKYLPLISVDLMWALKSHWVNK